VTTVSEFISAAVSDRGLNESRPQNEDSYVELPQYGLFAVADGVGGAQAGEVASQMAVEILGEAFVNMGENADPEDTMRLALERANEAIYQMSHDLPQLSSMATTIVAVHVSGDMATIAHVGDSRVYRVDGNGRLFRETDDHSVVEEEVRAGRMTPEQALNHPSRNVISRALGAEETVVPDVKCVLVHPGTTFLLCSDGITRHIDDAEIESLLSSDFGPDDICSRMKEICFSRGAEDNLTAVVLRFPGEPRLAAVDPEDDEDIEEVTLAGVRETIPADADADENIEISAARYQTEAEPNPSRVNAEEIAAVAEPNDDEAYLLENAESMFLNEVEPESKASTEPAELQNVEDTPVEPTPARTVSSYDYESEASAAGGFGRAASAIAFLIVGIILGAAASYFLMRPAETPQSAMEVPALPVQQSENVSLTSFEKMRRLVDEDPVKFLNARAASPQEADDFFWLGRALLLTGKPVEARRQFEEARTRLASFDDRTSARTMTNEIAMAMAILDSPQATENFAKQLAAANATSSNVNTVSNSAMPVR
jgi:serine/threonine protein phosphatase PrpC